MTVRTEIKPAAEDAFAGAKNHGWPDLISGLEGVQETHVLVDSLVPGFYLRQAGTDVGHIRLLADAAGTVKLPPILVQRSGCRIIDGMHRVEAAKLRGERSICANLLDCTDEEALVLAIRSNIQHGLPLSRSDRISGAKRILAAHRNWSDRAVAEIAGLSAKTIASLRNRSTADIKLSGKRLGRDGKLRPVSAAEGRMRAVAYIEAHPEAPIREIAREADVSIGTAYDVRQKIHRGSDPIIADGGRGAGEVAKAVATHATAPGPLLARALQAHAEKHNPQLLAWRAISAKLISDPALKYAEGGRAFLRWMAMHSAGIDEWREFIDAIPIHWSGDVSRVADTMSMEWSEFAKRLRSKQVTAV